MNYQMLSMDELLLELESNRLTREAIQTEIRKRADEELVKIEARKAELLALTEKPNSSTKPKAVPTPWTARKAGPPKYRHPSGETWTGRGAKPVWMKNWIANGYDPNELLIAA